MHSLQTQQAAAAVKAAIISLLVTVADEHQLELSEVVVFVNVDDQNDVSCSYTIAHRDVELAGGVL